MKGAINLSEKNKYYSIGKVSSICDVPIKTLRYYDQIGLLVPQYRKEDGHYRYYEHTQLLTLHIIRKLRLLGVSLKDIQRIIQNCDNAAMEQCVVSRMHEISKNIETSSLFHDGIPEPIDIPAPQNNTRFFSLYAFFN